MTEPFGPAPTLADQMRRHYADSEHLYGHLMRAMADDWDAGGPVRMICAGWEDAPPGSVIQLRLIAGLFRVVLTGRAPELERFYPCLGGSADPATAWPAVRGVLGQHVEELRDALTIAPQTNEVGRANALLVGIFIVVDRTQLPEIRLLELGASAGLNLLVDKFRFDNQGWRFGPIDSPVRLSGGVIGRVRPAAFEVTDRRGCDVSPVDVSTEQGRLRLRSFVWPFDLQRHERLEGALAIARRSPPPVDKVSAAAWLEEQLDAETGPDVVTVVWQSVTRQYWPVGEMDRVGAAVAAAARRSPVAHICMEPMGNDPRSQAALTVAWSTGSGGDALHSESIGTVGDHGFPVTLTNA